jgi:hypothetical protein
MNKTLSTILIVIAILVVAGGVFFAGGMYARANVYGPSMMFGNGSNNTFGPGMMNGSGGYGMMGSRHGMMGGIGWNNGINPNVTPLTIDQARAAAEKYIQTLKLQGLETGEVMIFDNNAYVIVNENETGLGAFELLVDPASQIAYPEYGPNMMWNLKYSGLNHQYRMGGNGMMGGMMGGYGNMTFAPGASAGVQGWTGTTPLDVSAEMTVTPEQAVQLAQQYLDTNYAGTTAASHPMQFYGYYTLDFEKDGQIVGMLSINGYNGQIFLHTWHGTFIEESD